MRANASPRSFRSAEEIAAVISKLESGIAEKLAAATAGASSASHDERRGERTRIGGLQRRLTRARQAAEELRSRAAHRAERAGPLSATGRREPRFGRANFRIDADRDVLICPADQEESRAGRYRLFGRRDCRGCALKSQCTDGRGRRVKMPVMPSATDAGGESGAHDETSGDEKAKTAPQASLTDPEALMMLATSRKRWEPSFNTDISVTSDGIIVSQFVTKNPSDFPNFAPALANVLTHLGRPENWVGDGHYGSLANLVLADQQSVTLFAPAPASGQQDPTSSEHLPTTATNGSHDVPPPPASTRTRRFGAEAFRHQAAADVLVCPNERELALIGTYVRGSRAYRLYGLNDCGGCSRKAECTTGRGRRVKLPFAPDPAVSPQDPGARSFSKSRWRGLPFS